ncbi:hypothetical protein FS837_012776 [Tulasnella sp. UAMH 9824]|nr:hypothetical protein FS837_012776 [Tulasnella sp. UAMH 9824]
MASSVYNGSAKSHSGRGHGSENGPQPTYSGPGQSAVVIPATAGATATFGGNFKSSKGGETAHMEDDELSLTYPHSVFENTWVGSRRTSLGPDDSRTYINDPNSRDYCDIASSSSLSCLGQSFATSSTSNQSSFSDNTDCNIVVASKFFPTEYWDGKRQPLCEKDYFRRLNRVTDHNPLVKSFPSATRSKLRRWPTNNSLSDDIRLKSRTLTFSSVPWPVADVPEHPTSLNSSAVRSFLLSPHHSQGVPARERIEHAQSVWEPKSFMATYGPKMHEEDKKKIERALIFLQGTLRILHNEVVAADSESLQDNASITSLSSPGMTTSSLNEATPFNPTIAWTSFTAVASEAFCSACQRPMSGQVVRALGTDCNTVVASKFFPIEGADGKQQPLCERDYCRRLNLICAKCEQDLRGSYITACIFGPQDSYHEHNGDVYCHFHYSTRFATKCVGCSSAILKHVVEIKRGRKEECWHPQCYMIYKFWRVKVASSPTDSLPSLESEAYAQEEAEFNAITLENKQTYMETLVNRVWTHLSTFQESSAACISDMLRYVNNGLYLNAIWMAERFILHVEVLFATIDELETGFAKTGTKGMSHVREARMLCRETVDLFNLLSRTRDSSSSANPSQIQSQQVGMTQDPPALVTGLTRYLKMLTRIALTGALKLEREHSNKVALPRFLDRLQFLGMDGADPGAKRKQHVTSAKLSEQTTVDYSKGVAYGYRSLAPDCAGESPFSPKILSQPIHKRDSNWSSRIHATDSCRACHLAVEEDCIRAGTYERWHSHCIKCDACEGVAAFFPAQREFKAVAAEATASGSSPDDKTPSKVSSARRPPANMDEFRYVKVKVVISYDDDDDDRDFWHETRIFCSRHAMPNCHRLDAVSRLEQYAFLLNVALRRLYHLFDQRGVLHLTATSTPSPTNSDSPTNPLRDSEDILRTTSSVHLDRKLRVKARLHTSSTIIKSPTGKIAQLVEWSGSIGDDSESR